jgi:hypothetical protein
MGNSENLAAKKRLANPRPDFGLIRADSIHQPDIMRIQTHFHPNGFALPLLLCGPELTGKSYLLQAALRQGVQRDRFYKPLWLDPKLFKSHIRGALKDHKLDEYRSYLCEGFDDLYFDDLDLIDGGGALEFELGRLIRNFTQKGRRVILAGTFEPNDISTALPKISKLIPKEQIVRLGTHLKTISTFRSPKITAPRHPVI